MQTGFVNIFGRPNAGKSTLLNALAGEKLAIVSPKVQTTRHRIKAILTTDKYQVIFSDTPGIIDPQYKLHERMMQAVRNSLEDADIAVLLVDSGDDPVEADAVFEKLRLKAPAIVVLNKTDAVSAEKLEALKKFFTARPYSSKVMEVSALKGTGVQALLDELVSRLPEGEAYFPEDEMSDLPTKFFVGEMVREKIYQLYAEEIPYHTAVVVQEFKEKADLIKIRAEIVVQRETQKGILLGEGGQKIKALGMAARKDIEAFLGSKVFLELFVKVRPKWRDNDLLLKEYGYE
ncbi:GTPase Era [Dinghuibacter silviterrae]|uniref:GTPase Era n=1 Tax=Dinghuibacter silviterrae TaxID=1539049 RepID=A0A4R8DRB1_9BACT|nr:GTPase Era [Dinghuibacter silviterrae]TDX00720.1 GTP-binding protein Era [Dinghuibacter silviterrae]